LHRVLVKSMKRVTRSSLHFAIATMIVLAAPLSAWATEAACPQGPPLQDEEVLIGWVTGVRTTTQWHRDSPDSTTWVGPFRALALLKGSELVVTDGSVLRREMRFWPVLQSKPTAAALRSTGSFLDHLGDDHCVYFADLRGPAYKRFTLFSSRPVPGMFRSPTAEERAQFTRLNTTCVQQGDYPPNSTPPCVRPRLLAIRASEPVEYWATEPYIWDTGLTVWIKRGDSLVSIIQVCPGCSD